MGSFLSPEINTVLISTLIGLIVAGGGTLVAWLKAKTKQLNDMAAQTKILAEENKVILDANTKIAKNIERQTDGINKKMVAIAEVVAFTKGRMKGRAEGESNEPYEELERLEDQLRNISDVDFVSGGALYPKKERK